ncbi:MAG: helix-turn-helix transcriptional regulator [Spirochaetaceae bacterium]|nr:helix-turn-helix transcriptional regulator [Spirochaetaceae bacterium]MBQ4555024.1 helix-turn-helix transcriptional regulator [Spirochaetaceae bacterium]MBQ8353204.1 helix-turn-helix transcriptional regulator [Spirochaetaceae bacterium]
MKDEYDNGNVDLSLRKILSENIRNRRKELHLTQDRLAENADISLPYLSDIEHCKTWVSDKTLIKLAKALGKKPSDLLKENESIVQEKSIESFYADIIMSQKKQLLETINNICDSTFSELMSLH